MVGRRRPSLTHLPPANRGKSCLQRSLVDQRSVWFDPSRAHQPRLLIVGFRAARAIAWCYLKMFTARAATSSSVSDDRADSAAISAFAQRLSGIASVGLKAIELVNEM